MKEDDYDEEEEEEEEEGTGTYSRHSTSGKTSPALAALAGRAAKEVNGC